MTSIKTEATNGLVINQVNISNSIQIILTKFAFTVVRLPPTDFIFKHFNSRGVFNFYKYYAPNFEAKYLNKSKTKVLGLDSITEKICL